MPPRRQSTKFHQESLPLLYFFVNLGALVSWWQNGIISFFFNNIKQVVHHEKITDCH